MHIYDRAMQNYIIPLIKKLTLIICIFSVSHVKKLSPERNYSFRIYVLLLKINNNHGFPIPVTVRLTQIRNRFRPHCSLRLQHNTHNSLDIDDDFYAICSHFGESFGYEVHIWNCPDKFVARCRRSSPHTAVKRRPEVASLPVCAASWLRQTAHFLSRTIMDVITYSRWRKDWAEWQKSEMD